ncbi:MAG: hypothetical protein JWR51_4553 [Devosia sp.]|nr:hypothetical protein [Devosia sp.]
MRLVGGAGVSLMASNKAGLKHCCAGGPNRDKSDPV